MNTATDTRTFDDLCAIEPRLRELYDEARSYPSAKGFCANEVWYEEDGLKDRVSELVGWGAQRPELGSPEAYDIAYEAIYHALPDCQHSDSMCCS